MQVIGLCRFSYPGFGGFQVHHDKIEDRIAYLYQADRLEERFRLFETVALPSIREQTDQDFELVILIGDSLPRHHAQRLSDMVADCKQIRIEAHPPRPHRELMKEVLNRSRKDPNAPCLQFRFDDDDAISVDFVERLRKTADQCSGLLESNRAVAIDFNRGFVAEFGTHGAAVLPTLRPYFTAALGMYVAGGMQIDDHEFRPPENPPPHAQHHAIGCTHVGANTQWVQRLQAGQSQDLQT